MYTEQIQEEKPTQNIKEKTQDENMNQSLTSCSKIDYKKLMFEGLEDPNIWGYGFRRLGVKSTEDTKSICPYNFTSFGYKSQEKKLFFGMRMNVDQNSPVKFIEYNEEKNPVKILSDLMNLLVTDFIKTNKN